MRYNTIDKQLYIENRKNFTKHLKPGSLAVFTSNDILPTNADGAMGFRQNADLLYLTGIDQEDTMLILFPDVKDGKHKEVLFIKETSELIAIWEGAKLNKAEATSVSGIDHIYWIQDFDKIMKPFILQVNNIYLNECKCNTFPRIIKYSIFIIEIIKFTRHCYMRQRIAIESHKSNASDR